MTLKKKPGSTVDPGHLLLREPLDERTRLRLAAGAARGRGHREKK